MNKNTYIKLGAVGLLAIGALIGGLVGGERFKTEAERLGFSYYPPRSDRGLLRYMPGVVISRCGRCEEDGYRTNGLWWINASKKGFESRETRFICGSPERF